MRLIRTHCWSKHRPRNVECGRIGSARHGLRISWHTASMRNKSRILTKEFEIWAQTLILVMRNSDSAHYTCSLSASIFSDTGLKWFRGIFGRDSTEVSTVHYRNTIDLHPLNEKRSGFPFVFCCAISSSRSLSSFSSALLRITSNWSFELSRLPNSVLIDSTETGAFACLIKLR